VIKNPLSTKNTRTPIAPTWTYSRIGRQKWYRTTNPAANARRPSNWSMWRSGVLGDQIESRLFISAFRLLCTPNILLRRDGVELWAILVT
jgi:hypothetical protein